jgi:hypothetical protein
MAHVKIGVAAFGSFIERGHSTEIPPNIHRESTTVALSAAYLKTQLGYYFPKHIIPAPEGSPMNERTFAGVSGRHRGRNLFSGHRAFFDSGSYCSRDGVL